MIFLYPIKVPTAFRQVSMASYTDNRYFTLELLSRLEIIGINNVFLLSNNVYMQ
ncbi:MAG: hypothetical protein ABF508_09050 [Zymomonas mobilis]|uniref:hypothetical protein n=1 Tax=Zymomonas mobilis TaxID=542 RepID=UPI0039E97906